MMRWQVCVLRILKFSATSFLVNFFQVKRSYTSLLLKVEASQLLVSMETTKVF